MIIFLVSSLEAGFTHTRAMVSFTCPIDDHTFQQYTDRSGSSFDKRLDFKKLGPIVDPWSLPKCPKCGFIAYKDEFTPEELVHLKKYIYSDVYKNLKDDSSTYFCLANILKYLKKDNNTIAWTYLRASWQVEMKSKEKYKEYVSSVLSSFDTVSKEIIPLDKFDKEAGVRNHIGAQYMCIELNRRLGNFQKAEQYIKSFPKELHNDEKWIMVLVQYQEQLISEKDDKPHKISDSKKKAK